MGDNVCGNKSSCSGERKGQLCAKEVQSLERKKCCAIIRWLEHRKEGDLWKEDCAINSRILVVDMWNNRCGEVRRV